MLSSLLLATVASLACSADPAPTELTLGDAAPKIETKEFVKGEPVKEFAAGKTYVVEFWATWCAPCRESIPHLSEMQKKFKDVAFIGVSVDDDADQVKPFVDKMGDKMDYRVAIDARDDKRGRMGKTWLDASDQGGIPTAYVVNGQGKIAWIGHPGELEDPLKQIVDGKWDLVAKAAEYKKVMEDQKFSKHAEERVAKLLQDKDYAEALKLCEEIVKRDAVLAVQFGEVRLALMAHLHKDAEKIVALAKERVKDAEEKNTDNALLVLRSIVSPADILNPDSEAKTDTPEKLDPAVAKFAAELADKIDAQIKSDHAGKPGEKPLGGEAAAEESDNIGESGFQVADSYVLLARAYQACGDKAKAAAKCDAAVKALNSVIRAARDDIKDVRDMKKAFSGDAADKAADDDKSSEQSSDGATDKPVVRRKKIEP